MARFRKEGEGGRSGNAKGAIYHARLFPLFSHTSAHKLLLSVISIFFLLWGLLHRPDRLWRGCPSFRLLAGHSFGQ